jgi:phage gp36-like protein
VTEAERRSALREIGMSYITQIELEDYITERELIQLTDDAKLGVVDAEKVAAAIAAACADIDSYAGTKYALPLAASEKVKSLARDIAIWNLEKRRRKIRPDTQTAYDVAMKFLIDLSTGKAKLDQPTGEPAQASESNVLTTSKEEVFGDDDLDHY